MQYLSQFSIYLNRVPATLLMLLMPKIHQLLLFLLTHFQFREEVSPAWASTYLQYTSTKILPDSMAETPIYLHCSINVNYDAAPRTASFGKRASRISLNSYGLLGARHLSTNNRSVFASLETFLTASILNLNVFCMKFSMRAVCSIPVTLQSRVKKGSLLAQNLFVISLLCS